MSRPDVLGAHWWTCDHTAPGLPGCPECDTRFQLGDDGDLADGAVARQALREARVFIDILRERVMRQCPPRASGET